MNDYATMQQMLSNIQAAHDRADLPEHDLETLYWDLIHLLAEAGYEPARAFFLSCLTDRSRGWRLDAIRALQHYGLTDDDDVAERIRYMLYSDPEPDVRITAAGMLGALPDSSDWPDWALEVALDDPIKMVRLSAFVSLLRMAGISQSDTYYIGKEIREDDLPITWEALEQRLLHAGINIASLRSR